MLLDHIKRPEMLLDHICIHLPIHICHKGVSERGALNSTGLTYSSKPVSQVDMGVSNLQTYPLLILMQPRFCYWYETPNLFATKSENTATSCRFRPIIHSWVASWLNLFGIQIRNGTSFINSRRFASCFHETLVGRLGSSGGPIPMKKETAYSGLCLSMCFLHWLRVSFNKKTWHNMLEKPSDT